MIIHAQIQERELKADRAVKVVEKVTPAVKNGRFVLVLSQLVVDVLKLNGFGILGIRCLADAVGIHAQVRVCLLGCDRNLAFTLSPGNGAFNAISFLAAEFSLDCFLGGQSLLPPCPDWFAALRRHRSCWSGKVASSVG